MPPAKSGLIDISHVSVGICYVRLWGIRRSDINGVHEEHNQAFCNRVQVTYPWWLGKILHSCPLALAVATTTALAARHGGSSKKRVGGSKNRVGGSENRVTLGSVSGGAATTAAALGSAILLPALSGALRAFVSGRRSVFRV